MASLVDINDMNRDDLLEAMHKDTAKIAKDGYDKLSRFANAGVLLCIEIGCQIDRLTDNEAVENKSLEVTKLAVYWGMDNTNRLYEWRNTAAIFCKETDKDTGKIIYDKSFISEQMQDPMVNGKLLKFEHFKHLGRVSSAKKRTSLLSQTRKNGWSSNALADEIKGSVEVTTNTRTGGRKPVIPGTVFQYIQKTYTQAQKLNNFLAAGESDVLDKFAEVSTDKADDGFIDKIDTTIVALEHLQETTQRNIDILLNGRDRVVDIIENTVEHVKSEDASTEDEEDYVTGTQMAAKIRESANPKKKKKKAAKKQLRPRMSKK